MVSRLHPEFSDTVLLSTFIHSLNLQGHADECGAESDDDLLSFMDEESADSDASSPAKQSPWVLLIVDDEQQVHDVTTLTLRRSQIANRPFRFLHAYSAAQAKEIISAEPHIDLVLLDVVMETRDAGLRLVTELRGTMGRHDLKILIRSGQPGLENSSTLCERYPIDGYMQKTEQTYALMMEVIGNLLLNTKADRGRAN